MANKTLWESICARSGRDGMSEVSINDAIAGSVVTQGIARVEIARFVGEHLIEMVGEDRLRLTETGRASCNEIHHSPSSVTNISSEPESE
jgi:hypothetical protein